MPTPRALWLVAVVVLLGAGLFAQGAYYNSIDTSSATFVTELHELIYPHTKLSYSITDAAEIVAVDTTGGQKYVVCVYTGDKRIYTPPWIWSDTFSREHTFCHSWMPTYSSQSGPEYSDLHHLFPTHQNNANGRRSNHPLGVVTNVSYQYLDGKLGTNSLGQTVYEPRDEQKGNSARALFYMATAYNGVNGEDWSFGYLNTVTLPALSEAAQDVDLLKQWHSQDPPDDGERARNDSVYTRQGNRNPFVDHPEYVNVIDFTTMTKSWGDTEGGGGEGVDSVGNAPAGMALVVNEYKNTGLTTDEWIELLVLQDSVDLRGVKVRDYSGTGSPQGASVFSANSSWSNVRHGTLIVLLQFGSAGTEDTDFSDKLAILKVSNATYFSSSTNFAISATSDAVEILTSSGTHIHSLGHGAADTVAPAPRGHVAGSSTSGNVVRFMGVNDTTDFKSDAYVQHSSTATMGLPNDATEEEFIGGLLPVELMEFYGEAVKSGAFLRWRTATEADNLGWSIERRNVGILEKWNRTSNSSGSWDVLGFVNGAGTSTSPRSYSFTDAPQGAGRYAYRLKQIDRSGTFAYSFETEVEVGSAPKAFMLGEAYPNPFNPETTVEFTLADADRAVLRVYDVLGREAATLFDGIADAGRMYRQRFDASRISTGLYFVRLESGGNIAVRKLVYLR